MINVSPSDGNILCSTRTTTGTLITIPAAGVWTGHLVIAASIAAAGTGTPRISVSGTNAEPADGTVVHQLSLSGLALTTVADSCMTEVIVKAPAGNSITLEFNTGGATSASASATGFLI